MVCHILQLSWRGKYADRRCNKAPESLSRSAPPNTRNRSGRKEIVSRDHLHSCSRLVSTRLKKRKGAS